MAGSECRRLVPFAEVFATRLALLEEVNTSVCEQTFGRLGRLKFAIRWMDCLTSAMFLNEMAEVRNQRWHGKLQGARVARHPCNDVSARSSWENPSHGPHGQTGPTGAPGPRTARR